MANMRLKYPGGQQQFMHQVENYLMAGAINAELLEDGPVSFIGLIQGFDALITEYGMDAVMEQCPKWIRDTHNALLEMYPNSREYDNPYGGLIAN